MHGQAYRGKRVLDLFLLAISAPLTVPIIGITSALIALVDGRPVLFKQERAGLNGDPFELLKFRTMKSTTDIDLSGLTPSARITKSDAARITPLGRLLRKSSLDELPQLMNVLRGDMSIVGPRPLFTRYNQYYSAREALRLSVLPGITGYSQTACRNHGGWRERLEFDAKYVERASVFFDVRLILRTIGSAVRSEGVSVIAGATGDALDDERSFPSEGSLTMRRIYARDLPTRVRWLSNPDVRRHMTIGDHITLDSTLEWHKAVRENPRRRDYVFETTEGQLVAMSGVKLRENSRVAEFYVFVDPEAQGRGFGSAATRLTLRESAREDLIDTVWLSVVKENHAAVKIYHRLGFEVVEEVDVRFGMQVDLSLYRAAES